MEDKEEETPPTSSGVFLLLLLLVAGPEPGRARKTRFAPDKNGGPGVTLREKEPGGGSALPLTKMSGTRFAVRARRRERRSV